MTRKTQAVLTAAVVLTGLAVGIPLWLTRDTPSPVAEAPPAHTDSTPSGQPPAPLDPQALAEVREAYQQVIAEGAPPGMADWLQGRDRQVTPVRYNPEPDPNLPPLPPDLAARPELLPPPEESSAGPPAELPPLPPK
jgi:hypothetical protein